MSLTRWKFPAEICSHVRRVPDIQGSRHEAQARFACCIQLFHAKSAIRFLPLSDHPCNFPPMHSLLYSTISITSLSIASWRMARLAGKIPCLHQPRVHHCRWPSRFLWVGTCARPERSQPTVDPGPGAVSPGFGATE